MKSETAVRAKLKRLMEVGVVTFYTAEKPAMPFVTSKKEQLRAIRKALEWVLSDADC
jgi:hypothetical protein